MLLVEQSTFRICMLFVLVNCTFTAEILIYPGVDGCSRFSCQVTGNTVLSDHNIFGLWHTKMVNCDFVMLLEL